MKSPAYRILLATVFLCGAVGMMLELITSRIVAPYYGTTFVVWTNIIAVVLGGLSYGYWLGGKKGDRNPTSSYLSALVFTGGCIVVCIALCKEIVLYAVSRYIYNVPFGSLIAVLVLFGPLNVLLGMITPYAVGLFKKNEGHVGKLVGNLYAIGTVGSIAGIYSVSYLLLPWMGHVNILYVIALLLFILSFFISKKKYFLLRMTVVIITLTLLVQRNLPQRNQNKVLIDLDSIYGRVWIATYRRIFGGENYNARILLTDAFTEQSGFNIDAHKPIEWSYLKIFRYSRSFQPKISDALMIGGASNAFAYFFSTDFPASRLDIVEIDPFLTKLARAYFHFKESGSVAVKHEDGRVYVNRTKDTYDAIYVDAFNGIMPVPYLNTKEAYTAFLHVLKKDGVVYINTVSTLNGKGSYTLNSLYTTLREVFPTVLIIPTKADRPHMLQNVVLVGMKSPHPNLSRKYPLKPESRGTLLTDDYVPLDIVTPVYFQYTGESTDKYRRLLLPSYFESSGFLL